MADRARAPGRRKEVEDPNNTWNMQLMAVALRGDLSECASLVAKGADVNHSVPEPMLKNAGVTPFIAVALRAAAAQPVGLHGNPNAVAPGQLPFAQVLPVLQWLCQNNANPNQQLDGSKGTVFHHAVRHDYLDLVDKLLLNRPVMSLEPPPPPVEVVEDKKAKASGKAKPAAAAVGTAQLAEAPPSPVKLAGDGGDAHGLVDASTAEDTSRGPAEPRDLFDLDVADDQGLTALQLAVQLGKADMGRVFLRHAVRHGLNHAVDATRTAARRACDQNNAALLETLLNLGDDAHQLDRTGATLLHAATAQPQCLDVLMDRGVSLSLPNAQGRTPLSQTVAASPLAGDVLDGLISRGVDVNAGDAILGTTPLIHAVIGYAPDAVRRLVVDGKADVNARDRLGCTALHYAAVARGKGILEQLVQCEGIDFNARDAIGQTALHRACHVLGKAEFVAALVAKDAVDVNVADDEGNTALHVAVSRGNAAAVRALFPRVDAATINGPAPAGVPPVAAAPAATGKGDAKKAGAPAAKKGGPQVAEVIVSKLAVNAENADGRTALQLASAMDAPEMVALLASIGADVRRASAYGNLVHEAVVHQREAGVRLLAGDRHQGGINDRNADDKTPLHLAVETSAADVVQAVLDCGGDVDAQDAHKLTAPLHVAVGLRAADIRDLLLAAGASATVYDSFARTPLHIACAVGDESSVELLLRAGASATATDINGSSPLHTACASDAAGCIEPLLAAGAAFWARDNRDRTPLHVAVACAAERCTKALCDYIVEYNRVGAAALPRRKSYNQDDSGLPALQASGYLPPAGRQAGGADGDDENNPEALDQTAQRRPASRTDSRGGPQQRRAPTPSQLQPAPTIAAEDGVTPIAVDGAAARAAFLRQAAQAAAETEWRHAMQLQDVDGMYPLALAAACGSRAIAQTLVKTNAALTAQSRARRPPSVSTRPAMDL